MQELRGRTAVITGGGSGLGAAMARAFCAEGMRVVLADIAFESAEAVATELQSQGYEALPVPCDVADPRALAALADAARGFGGCQLLCVNVGVVRIGHSDTLSLDDWRWVTEVNVLGSVATTQAMLPLLREAPGEKHILFTSSVSGLVAAPCLSAYTASKYAVTGYAETLRLELADENIGVGLLFPNGMDTPHFASSLAARPESLGEAPSLDMADAQAVAEALTPSSDSVIDVDHAIRHLVPAIRENRPYLMTHAPNRASLDARLHALLDVVAHADD